jgi:hypothetical protein
MPMSAPVMPVSAPIMTAPRFVQRLLPRERGAREVVQAPLGRGRRCRPWWRRRRERPGGGDGRSEPGSGSWADARGWADGVGGTPGAVGPGGPRRADGRGRTPSRCGPRSRGHKRVADDLLSASPDAGASVPLALLPAFSELCVCGRRRGEATNEDFRTLGRQNAHRPARRPGGSDHRRQEAATTWTLTAAADGRHLLLLRRGCLRDAQPGASPEQRRLSHAAGTTAV